LTSGVPERAPWQSTVVVFNLGRGGVPRGRPVAGQLSGTPLCAGLTCVCVWGGIVLAAICWAPTPRVRSITFLWKFKIDLFLDIFGQLLSFNTAGTMAKLFAWGGEDSGGHVL
jgi:hypothetical protein